MYITPPEPACFWVIIKVVLPFPLLYTRSPAASSLKSDPFVSLIFLFLFFCLFFTFAFKNDNFKMSYPVHILLLLLAQSTPDSPYPMYSIKDMETYGFNSSSCKHITEEFLKMQKNDCVPLSIIFEITNSFKYLSCFT